MSKAEELSSAELLDMVPVKKIMPEAKDGRGAMLIMRDQSYRMVLQCGGLNMDMKSPIEREVISAVFGTLNNSLSPDGPVQYHIRTREFNMSPYLRAMEKSLVNRYTPNELKEFIQDHQAHLENVLGSQRLLMREYYLVVRYRPAKLAKKEEDDDSVMAIVRKRFAKEQPIEINALDLSTAQQQLEMRTQNVQDILKTANIWSRRLDEEAIRKLLWELFHPGKLR